MDNLASQIWYDPQSKTPLNAGQYPVVKSIPRFVSSDHYSAAFGLQWKTFPKLQLDSANRHTISIDRLKRCFGGSLKDLSGKWLLEAGCGSGRFTEHFLSSGAKVCAIDASIAVEANYDNLKDRFQYWIAQADIFKLPVLDSSFDYVVCLGVLQHLPDPELGMAALWKKVKPGGTFVIDHYTGRFGMYLKLHWIYRLILKRMPPKTSLKIVNKLVDLFFPIHWIVRNSRFGTMILNRVSPCLTYFQAYPELDKKEQEGLTRLDSYDALTDFYKHVRTTQQIRHTLEKMGAIDIHVQYAGNGVEALCRKPE